MTLERLCALVSPGAAAAARERSAELRGLLAEIAREHGINRALMRQELAFLAHLTRLVGHEPEAGYRPAAPPAPTAGAGAAARSTASWTSRPSSCRSPPSTASRPRCAGCSPSSGCSTRRATTSPTRRPRATPARRPRWPRPPRSRSRRAASPAAPARTSARASTSRPTAASATSSSTSSTAPRTRASASGRRAPRRLDRAELALAEPGDNGINEQLVEVLGRLVATSQRPPDDQSPAEALVEQAARAGRRVQDRRRAARAREGAATAEYAGPRPPACTGDAGGEVAQIGERDRRAQRHDQALRHRRRHAERPAGPPRPAARPAVGVRPGLGRRQGRRHRSTSASATALRRHDVRRSSTGTTATGPARPPATPGRPAAASAACSTLCQARRHARRLPHRARRHRRRTLADAVNAVLPAARFFDAGAGPDGRDPRRRRRADGRPPADRTPAHGDSGANDLALARLRSCAATRPTRPTARSWPASAPRSARPTARRPTPRRSPTPSRTAARASSGVSLDEEMANLVRFQRAYQASSRAMSTMDEMLDVLINRTGTGRPVTHAHHHRRWSSATCWPTSTRHRAAHALAAEGGLRQGDHAPVGRPVQRGARAWRCARRSSGTQQYQRNIEDARAGRTRPSTALSDDHRRGRSAPASCSCRAAPDSTDQAARNAIAEEIDQLIEASSRAPTPRYRGSYVFAGTETGRRRTRAGADDTYHGDDGGSDPAIAGIVREIGPGVTMTINIVGATCSATARPPATASCSHVLRDVVAHLRAGDGAALRGTDLDAARHEPRQRARRPRAQRRRAEPARGGALAPRSEVEEATVTQLSETEDADIAKTLIELNSQQAAYQAALARGGEHRPVIPHGLPPLGSRTSTAPPVPRTQGAIPNVHLTVESSRFGTLEIEAGAVIEFPTGLIGLGGRAGASSPTEPDSPFAWLHSLDDPTLALPVTEPVALLRRLRGRAVGRRQRALRAPTTSPCGSPFAPARSSRTSVRTSARRSSSRKARATR